MDYSQFSAMIPELIVLGIFILVFLFDTFASESARKADGMLTTVLFGLGTVAICFTGCLPQECFGGMYVCNSVSFALKCILNIGVFIVLVQSLQWTDSEDMKMRRGEFYELLLATLFGMYLMISARHFLLFVIGLETASLPLAALIAFNKKHYESNEAAAKYIMTAVFSSAVLMMGLSFVYGLSGGSLYYNDVAAAVANGEMSGMLIVALAFVLAGIGFKLSLVPFVIFVQAFGAVYPEAWEWMLYGIIILTITVGNLFAIRQKNMKRFMAFSSVSQAGYIMLGVIAANAIGMTSMLFYILVYIFSNLGAFGVIQAIGNKSGKLNMDDYKGLHKSNPWLAFAMTLAMFSLAGIPPFAGFFSKILIFTSVTASNSMALYMLVLIALINTIISLYYYLLVVKAMWIAPEDPVVPAFRSACSERFGMWICVAGIVFIRLVSPIYGWLSEMSNLDASQLFAWLG